VAYIPIVRKGKEPGAAARAQQRRSAILQRVLYLVFRSTIAASHIGVKVALGNRSLLAFPRLLLYICDCPEEKAILCLKGGKTPRPCSMCRVSVAVAGAPEALDATDRDGRRDLEDQIEAARLLLRHELPSRRLMLEKKNSAHSRMPALAGMAGLSTAPFLMYKMLGIDALHVRWPTISLSLLLHAHWRPPSLGRWQVHASHTVACVFPLFTAFGSSLLCLSSTRLLLP